MRFVHTSDWHSGRIFYGVSLTQDQSCALTQIEALLKDVKPDALLISGEVQ